MHRHKLCNSDRTGTRGVAHSTHDTSSRQRRGVLRGASSRMRRLPGGDAPGTQYQRAHWELHGDELQRHSLYNSDRADA